jgi:predicted RNase H-like HicB family nuclease
VTTVANQPSNLPRVWLDVDGYVAILPSHPRVSGHGDTPEEAVRELAAAVGLVEEVRAEDARREGR